MQNSIELLNKLRDYRPHSDVHRFKEFIGSDLHLDFKNEIVARMLQMQSTLSDAINTNAEEMYRTQGGLVAMDLVLNIFENLLTNKETDMKIEEINHVEEE